MPRNVFCEIVGCTRWITTRRYDAGKTICSYHEKKKVKACDHHNSCCYVKHQENSACCSEGVGGLGGGAQEVQGSEIMTEDMENS